MNLSWDRGRVFDQTIGAMFLRSIQHLGTAAVTDVTQKEKTRSRPCALNTVEMMRCVTLPSLPSPHACLVPCMLGTSIRAPPEAGHLRFPVLMTCSSQALGRP